MNNRDFVTTGTDFGRTGFAPSWSTAAALAATNVITINNRAQGLVGGTWGYNWQWGSFVLGTESDFDGVFGCRNDNNGNFGFFGSNNNDTCGGTAIGLAAVGPPVPGRLFHPESTGHHPQPRLAFHLAGEGGLPGHSLVPDLRNGRCGARPRPREQRNHLFKHAIWPWRPRAGYCARLKRVERFADPGRLRWWRRVRVAARHLRPVHSPFFRDLSFKAEALYYDLGRSNLDTARSTEPRGHPEYQHRHSHYLA